MKKYILPTLISLAIGSSWVLAEEVAPQQPPAPPVAEQPPAVAATPAEDMMKVRQAHKQYVQEQLEKIRAMKDPEERRRLIQGQMLEMQQVMQEMQMLSNEGRTPPPGYAGPEAGNWGGGPGMGAGNWEGGPGMGGPGGWGGGPDFGPGMGGGSGAPNASPRRQIQQAHWASMEKHLENIEKMLGQLIANQGQVPAK